MKAATLRMTSPEGKPYTFPDNMAPSSCIEIHTDVPRPKPSQAGELIIRVKAGSVFKDNLDWNELYPPHAGKLGNDFSGIVAEVHADETEFAVGDHVYGMSDAKRGGIWAEYALVTADEAVRKPDSISWEEAATLGTSVLTADQALFVHSGLDPDARAHPEARRRVLVTGAAGGIGQFVVQFAALAGHEVVAATSDEARNGAFLREIGASEVVEYKDFKSTDKVDLVVDSAGFEALDAAWDAVKPDGTIVSFDSSSWGYTQDHKRRGLSDGHEGVRALYFIVEPSRTCSARISKLVDSGRVKGRVLKTVELDDVRAAYESVHQRGIGHGRIVVLPTVAIEA